MSKNTKIVIVAGIGVLVVAALCCGGLYAFGGEEGGKHRLPGPRKTTKTVTPKPASKASAKVPAKAVKTAKTAPARRAQ